MEKNVLKKLENLNLTVLEKVVVKIFRKTFCKVYVGALEEVYGTKLK